MNKPKLLNNVKFLQKCILLNEEGKILALLRHPDDPRRPNCWDLPGGNYESGEEVNESLKREIREEVNLEAQSLQPVYLASSMGVTYEGMTVFAVCQICRKWKGELSLSNEHIEYRWVTPEDFMKLETGDDGGFLKNSVVAFKELPY